MSTKFGSQQKQSPEDNTGGVRINTSASRYNQKQGDLGLTARRGYPDIGALMLYTFYPNQHV